MRVVSYLVKREHVPHPRWRRRGTLTMRQYYDAFHVDGRALLRGTPDYPRTWIAELDGRLLVCHCEAMAARRVADTACVPSFAIYDRGVSDAIH